VPSALSDLQALMEWIAHSLKISDFDFLERDHLAHGEEVD
jgi:hypothetical protein